jgi:membrane-bound ClpP family serine protease
MGRIARLLSARRWRRLAVAVLLILGAILLWASVAAPSGAVVMLLGLALEAVGLALEHRDL